jgi:hypothetical protein
MNTAFLDAVNLAWKIHHVESGFASRSILNTYESERKLIAENLLDFDARYAKLFSARIPSAGEVGSANTQAAAHAASQEGPEESDFVKTFKASCEFTSGYGVAYNANLYNWSPAHPAKSPLFLSYQKGTHLRPGRILTPATVTRVVDANIVHLEQEIPLNGSFRVYIFAGTPAASSVPLKDFATHLTAPRSFFSTYHHQSKDVNRYHERHNPDTPFLTLATIVAAHRADIDVDDLLPPVLARYRDHVYADDVWDARVPGAKAAAHVKVGLDEEKGGVVVVRPDGYVGCVVKLEKGSGTVDALNAYFGSFSGNSMDGEEARL